MISKSALRVFEAGFGVAGGGDLVEIEPPAVPDDAAELVGLQHHPSLRGLLLPEGRLGVELDARVGDSGKATAPGPPPASPLSQTPPSSRRALETPGCDALS